jgi:hypothetical protein
MQIDAKQEEINRKKNSHIVQVKESYYCIDKKLSSLFFFSSSYSVL